MILQRNSVFARIHQIDIYLCLFANKACQRRLIKNFFSVISRMGNGVFWYLLIALIPVVYGFNMLHVSVRMTVVGLTGLAIYKVIKSLTERPRPYKVNTNIQVGTSPLDQYSFPSGHTLHAVSFGLTAVYYIPALSWVVIPFAILVGLSRIILGLHYPTDVLAGIVIGTSLALTGIVFF
ncbi:MAG: phosphatase PAP2 family protein [Gammaproteobacteria bacterium]|nr:phosphatase PAP2 family protein [Gammaproteobacteria bacterium]